MRGISVVCLAAMMGLAAAQSNSTIQKFVVSGGAQCTSSADCGSGQGACGSNGCLCWQGFTCRDCSRACDGVWPSSCSNDCPEPVAIGGAECKTCLDCFNCDGGTCDNGVCKCYAGWTCSYCEWNSNNGPTTCGGFSPKGKGSGKLSGGSIFGICFGGALALLIIACCFKGSVRDWSERRSVQEDRAKRADLVAKAKQAGQDPLRSVIPRDTITIPQKSSIYPTDHNQMNPETAYAYPSYSPQGYPPQVMAPPQQVYAQQYVQPQQYGQAYPQQDSWNTPRQMYGPPGFQPPYGQPPQPYY